MNMNIGEKIKNARKSSGLSQQELGGDKFTKGYISQIEKGYVAPSMKVLRAVSEKLNIPVSYFVQDGDDTQKKYQERFVKAQNLYFQKDYSSAFEIFKSITDSGCSWNSSVYGVSFLYMGKCLFFLKKYKESIDSLNMAYGILNEVSSYRELVDCKRYAASCLFNQKYFKEAIDEYSCALHIMDEKSLEMADIKANIYLNIGTAYSNVGNPRVAMKYFSKNIMHCQENYNADTLLDSCVRMGYCAYRLSMYEKAKEYLSKAASINRTLKSGMAGVEISITLGVVIAKEGKVQAGLNILSKAEKTAQNIDYRLGMDLCKAYRTFMMIDSGKIDEAYEYAIKEIPFLKKSEDKFPLYLMKEHLGYIYLKKGDIQKGKEYMEQVINNFEGISYYGEASKCAKLLADSIIKTNPDMAKMFYDRSIEDINKTM